MQSGSADMASILDSGVLTTFEYGKSLQTSGRHASRCDTNHGSSGGFSAAGSPSQASRVILGADFRGCDHSVHHSSENLVMAALCGNGARRHAGSPDRNVFFLQRVGVCGRNFPVRSALRCSAISGRLPLCRDYGEYCSVDRAHTFSVDRGCASLCGSVGGHRGGARAV